MGKRSVRLPTSDSQYRQGSDVGCQAHSGSIVLSPVVPNRLSTEQLKAADRARAALTEGTSREPSIALTAAREMPALRANSACDQPWRKA